MKNKSVIALMLAFMMCFTSVCPAFAAENTAVENEEAEENLPEETEEAAPAASSEEISVPDAPQELSDEDAVSAEDTAQTGENAAPAEYVDLIEDVVLEEDAILAKSAASAKDTAPADDTDPVPAEDVSPEKDHTIIHVSAKEAACEAEGNIEYWVCSDCGKLYSDAAATKEIKQKDTVISATGHKWNTIYTVDREPTASSDGLKSIHCMICGAAKPESVQTIPGLRPSWKKDSTGWWYDRGDGSYPVSKFEMVDGATYYFNGAGYMMTGWQYLDSSWYYFGGSGAMARGWQYLGGAWYYLSGSGAMMTGWQKLDGVWYYLGGSGAMVTGWEYLGGAWYYLGGSGAMVTGTVVIDGEEYFFDDNGAMK